MHCCGYLLAPLPRCLVSFFLGVSEGICDTLRMALLLARAGAQYWCWDPAAVPGVSGNGLSDLRAALAQTGVPACIPAACPHTCCLPGPEHGYLWWLRTAPGVGLFPPGCWELRVDSSSPLPSWEGGSVVTTASHYTQPNVAPSLFCGDGFWPRLRSWR